MPTTNAPRKPTVSTIPKTSDLTAFARDNEAIHVRNTMDMIAVFTMKVDGADEVSEFGPANDPKGDDIMELPSSYLKNAQFRKQLQRGVFEIIDGDDPAVVEAFSSQKRVWEASQAAKSEADHLVDRNQVRAFSGLNCIAQEGRGTCPEFAISASKNNREKPPLCSKHAHLSSQYTPEETGKFVEGKPEIQWNRVQIQGR